MYLLLMCEMSLIINKGIFLSSEKHFYLTKAGPVDEKNALQILH